MCDNGLLASIGIYMTSSHGVLNYVMLVVMGKDTVHDTIHYAIEQLHAM